MIDTHIHLDSERYRDIEGICQRAIRRGVEGIVVPGISARSNLEVLRIAERFPALVHPALGLHPELPGLEAPDLDAMLDAVRHHRQSICAIGEVGLPYYGPDASNPRRQALARTIVEAAACLARELDLAVILHAPHETAATALQILRDGGARRAVFHWHKSEKSIGKTILEAGFFISLTPEVVWRERDRELVRFAPLDQMVVETDGPYPHQRVFPGAMTEPWMVSEAIAAIADIKGLKLEKVTDITSGNARKLFALSAAPPAREGTV